jgi:hypothetical protein
MINLGKVSEETKNQKAPPLDEPFNFTVIPV